LYRLVNKRRAGIGTVLENSVKLTADHDKARAFNSYFAPVGSTKLSHRYFYFAANNFPINFSKHFLMFYTQKLKKNRYFGKPEVVFSRKIFLENSPLNSASYGVEIISVALTVPEILD